MAAALADVSHTNGGGRGPARPGKRPAAPGSFASRTSGPQGGESRWHDGSWTVPRSAGIPSVSLRRLLPDARFLGCKDLHVTGCSTDSRRLDPGQVFVALRGARRDGHDFAAAALERGATAVIVERPCPEAGPLQVVVADARRALGRLSQALAGDPSGGAGGRRRGRHGRQDGGRPLRPRHLRGRRPADGPGRALRLVRRRRDPPLRPDPRRLPRPWPRCWPRWSSAAAKAAIVEVAESTLGTAGDRGDGLRLGGRHGPGRNPRRSRRPRGAAAAR